MTTLREDVAALSKRVAQEFNKIREEVGNLDIATSAQDTSYGNYGYETVGDALDSLLYVPIAINSFTNSVGTKEMGTVVTSVTFNWTTNKTPTSIDLAGTSLEPELKTYTLSDLSISSAKSWTLTVTDEKISASKTTSVSFTNGVYYGVGSATAEQVDSSFILGLSKSLQTGKGKTFNANPGSGEYIYYALPTRYGTPSFYVGGFEGGFDKLVTIEFTNASGYTENYDVYRSTNAALGSTDVTVK